MKRKCVFQIVSIVIREKRKRVTTKTNMASGKTMNSYTQAKVTRRNKKYLLLAELTGEVRCA